MRILGVGDELPAGSRAAVTIGVYDGVHQGHQWLLRRLRKVGGLDVPLVVVTFDPHPLSVIRPVAAPRTLTSLPRKLAILADLGYVDACLVLPFDAARRDQSAAAFVEEVLVDRLHAGSVMVGADFRFGHDRDGDIELLQEMGARSGFTAYGVPLLPVSGATAAAPCSSTYIREQIRRGGVDEAAPLLGRPHQVDGAVVGISRPRTSRGVPTVVMRVDQDAAIPVEGSYFGRLLFADGRAHVAGLSIRQGLVVGPHALVDAHLGGVFNAEIGERVTLEFTRALWAAGRAEVAAQVQTRTDEIGQAWAAGGWGAAR